MELAETGGEIALLARRQGLAAKQQQLVAQQAAAEGGEGFRRQRPGEVEPADFGNESGRQWRHGEGRLFEIVGILSKAESGHGMSPVV